MYRSKGEEPGVRLIHRRSPGQIQHPTPKQAAIEYPRITNIARDKTPGKEAVKIYLARPLMENEEWHLRRFSNELRATRDNPRFTVEFLKKGCTYCICIRPAANYPGDVRICAYHIFVELMKHGPDAVIPEE